MAGAEADFPQAGSRGVETLAVVWKEAPAVAAAVSISADRHALSTVLHAPTP